MVKALNWLVEHNKVLLNEIREVSYELQREKNQLGKNHKLTDEEKLDLTVNIDRNKKTLEDLNNVRHVYTQAIEAIKALAIIKKNVADVDLPNWYIFFTNNKVKKEFSSTIQGVIYGK